MSCLTVCQPATKLEVTKQISGAQIIEHKTTLDISSKPVALALQARTNALEIQKHESPLTIQHKNLVLNLQSTGPTRTTRTLTATFTAGETVGGRRAVVLQADNQVYLASPGDTPYGGILGVTRHAASAGESVVVVLSGYFQDTALSFTPGQPVFFTDNGALAQTPPPAGSVQQLGIALAGDTLHLDKFIPIEAL